MTTPNPSPVRPDLDRIERRFKRIEPWEPGWDFAGMTEEDKTFAGHACQDVPALVAYARSLEAEVERLRGVTKAAYEEGFDYGAGAMEWTNPNLPASKRYGWENSNARAAAAPGEEGRKDG